MSRTRYIAIADDLTGAAEIAALGFLHGLRSTVVTSGRTAAVDAELVVYDTDSRLDSPAVAANKLAQLGRALAREPAVLVYKKTDSVLRGAVRAEVEALATALGRPRVVLLPANPSLGRTIADGQYAIDRVPLGQTSFAHDPHHPARSSSVLSLLGDGGSYAVVVRNAAEALPSAGLVVGNAGSSSDTRRWARQVAPGDLPAGGADFFSALLGECKPSPVAPASRFTPIGPALIVSGTTSASGGLRALARQDAVKILPLPREAAAPSDRSGDVRAAWIESVRSHLAVAGTAVVLYDGPLNSEPGFAGLLRASFARAVRDLAARGGLHHVIVEGGATAAAIARACEWENLQVVHEWARGVATLRPPSSPTVALTLKPGSYAWPAALWAHMLSGGSMRQPPVEPPSP